MQLRDRARLTPPLGMKTKPSDSSTEGLVTLDKFLKETGLSHTTGWRYRNRGWLKVINIAGRHYVAKSEIARFIRRARSGEFAQLAIRPNGAEVKP